MKNKCASKPCALADTLQLIGNKWVIRIIGGLLDGKKRFGELNKEIGDISTKMLTQQLRKMEQDELVSRKVYAQVPPKVEYTLTEKGKSLKPILKSIIDWGEKYQP